MAYVQLALAIIPLVVMVFQEFFSAQSRAREEGRVFKADRAAFDAAIDAALTRWRASAAKESQEAGNAWDSADGSTDRKAGEP